MPSASSSNTNIRILSQPQYYQTGQSRISQGNLATEIEILLQSGEYPHVETSSSQAGLQPNGRPRGNRHPFILSTTPQTGSVRIACYSQRGKGVFDYLYRDKKMWTCTVTVTSF